MLLYAAMEWLRFDEVTAAYLGNEQTAVKSRSEIQTRTQVAIKLIADLYHRLRVETKA